MTQRKEVVRWLALPGIGIVSQYWSCYFFLYLGSQMLHVQHHEPVIGSCQGCGGMSSCISKNLPRMELAIMLDGLHLLCNLKITTQPTRHCPRFPRLRPRLQRLSARFRMLVFRLSMLSRLSSRLSRLSARLAMLWRLPTSTTLDDGIQHPACNTNLSHSSFLAAWTPLHALRPSAARSISEIVSATTQQGATMQQPV